MVQRTQLTVRFLKYAFQPSSMTTEIGLARSPSIWSDAFERRSLSCALAVKRELRPFAYLKACTIPRRQRQRWSVSPIWVLDCAIQRDLRMEAA